ncbi:HpcH/HpaI aldolase/citrate lyase family protein [Pseudochelatococcus sp. B33]
MRLRSLLFAPGNQPRKCAKALAGDADAVCLDIEDAVPEAQKAEARTAIGTLLQAGPERPFYVRVNGLHSDHSFADFKAVVRPGLKGIVLPRCETAAALATVDWLLCALETEAGLERHAIEVIPTIETASGVANLGELRNLPPRFRRLSFGAWDYTLDTGITYRKDEADLHHARASIVMQSRAAGLEPPLDTSFPWIGDLEALSASAALARDMGFAGKACIHPEQVAIANAAFTPSAEELAEAREIVDGFRAAERIGEAAVKVRGRFVDYPIYEKARRLLERHREV